MSLADLQPNIPRAILEDYFWLIAGVPKSGKTTLFSEVVKKHYGDINKGLLVAFEKGYSALEVMAKDVNTWDDFEDIVDELVEEKDNLPFKLICLDTGDVMWEKAQEKVIEEWNRKNPNKRTDDIGGVGAKGKSDEGFGEGYNRAKKKIFNQIDRLFKAGYGVMVICHSKHKEIKQKDGLEYEQLVVSLPQSARTVFVDHADFMVFITVQKEKEGNDVVTKRYMHFRSDGYVDAGARFDNVPEKIEYDVDEFLNVFENAVQNKLGDNVDKIKQQQKQEKEEEAKKYVEAEKQEIGKEDLINELKSLVKQCINNGIIDKETIGNKAKNVLGKKDYTKVDDIDKLMQFRDYLAEQIEEEA